MKKGLRLTLLGSAAFIVFLVATAPAGLLAYLVQRATSIQLQSVSGSLWHGAAQQVSTPQIQLGPLIWRIHGWRLLLGELNLTLEIPANANNVRGRAELAVSILQKLSITNANLQADAEWVFTQAAIPVAAGGFFQLEIQSAEFRRKQLPQLSAQLHWHQAKVIYPQQLELGAYRLVLKHQPQAAPEYLLGEISDIDSPFKINGTIKIEQNGDYRFSARISADANAPQILKQTLLFAGTPDTSGSVPVERSGNIFQDYSD